MKRSQYENGESDAREPDIRDEYRHAVDCLVQCESVIQGLEEQLASKDEEISSRDRLILSLEEKIIQMSLDLASALAREDGLRHDLATAAAPAATSRPEGPPTEVDVDTPDFPEAMIASNEAKYRPVSALGRRKSQSLRAGQRPSWRRLGSNWRVGRGSQTDEPASEDKEEIEDGAAGVERSFTAVGDCGGSDSRRSSGLDESTSSKLGGLGQLFIKSCSWRLDDEVHANRPKAPHRGANEEEKAEVAEVAAEPGQGCRASNPRRTQQRRRSSRAFFEAQGVVFPVSSFEVLSKGCRSGHFGKNVLRASEGESKNEEWPEMG